MWCLQGRDLEVPHPYSAVLVLGVLGCLAGGHLHAVWPHLPECGPSRDVRAWVLFRHAGLFVVRKRMGRGPRAFVRR